MRDIMFKLVSKYKPSGDQPEAIKELVQGIKEGKRRCYTFIWVPDTGRI